MVKPKKKITRKILAAQLESRVVSELKLAVEPLIREELEEIVKEYHIPDTEALKKLIGEGGLKININLHDLIWTLKL